MSKPFLWLHSGVSFRPIMVAKVSSSTTSGLAHLQIRTLQPRRPRGNPAQDIPRKQGLLLNRPHFPVGDADREVEQRVDRTPARQRT